MRPSHTPFTARVLDELQPHFESLLDDVELRQAFGERLIAEMRGEAVSGEPIGRAMTDRQKLLARLLKQISLLNGLIEAVAMAAIFVRQFPYRETNEARGITKVAYLRYHYEHYLQDVYRIREALVTTVDVVRKDAVRSAPSKDTGRLAREHLDGVKKAILDAFDHVAGQRGRIVHEERYDDSELSRMDSLNFYPELIASDLFEGLEVVHEEAYRGKRAKVAREIERWQGELEKVIEAVFAELEPFVFGRERSKSCLSP